MGGIAGDARSVEGVALRLAGVVGPGADQRQLRVAEAERDRVLVARARAGEERAFAALVERYGQPVLSLCFASTMDAGEAEDLSQEVFVAAWRNLGCFRGESSFATWLFALARNACIDRARRSRRRPFVGLPEHASELAALEPSAGAVDAAEVFAAARRLSLPLRQALLLRDLQGLSYEEIAALEDVPVGTVRSRIAAARAALAEALRR